MGEIMRWLLTRAAQRRVPANTSLLQLGGPYSITSPTLNSLVQDFPQTGTATNDPTFVTHSSILANPQALRGYLSKPARGAATPAATVIQEFVELLQLDQWLAGTAPVPPTPPSYTTPAVADLTNEIATLGLSPNSNIWQTLLEVLSDLYYLALVFSALGVPFSLTEVLGLLTRWLLVMGLVGDLQQNPSPIQTPNDVYAALRWRTLVLPDAISLILLGIRLSSRAVLVRKPGFADLYITREEWDHYEAAEIASIEGAG